MTNWTVVCDDVVHWAETYSGPPFHAILADPPYELGFMGKRWDGSGVSFQPETWAVLAAHLLPGAHVLAFGGSRTHHRLMCAIEDAGLEIRDCIYWAFGSGFPKSLNVGKAIDKAAGAEREVVGQYHHPDGNGRKCQVDTNSNSTYQYGIQGKPFEHDLTAPATPAAAIWEGYGTALKPAVEVIVMARKPIEGTIAANCQRYGSGALAIDACRIEGTWSTWQIARGEPIPEGGNMPFSDQVHKRNPEHPAGRWPANLILSHLPECRRVGTKRVKHGGGTGEASTHNDGAIFGNETHGRFWYTDPDGLETVDAWECAPGCPAGLFPVTTSGGSGDTKEKVQGNVYGIYQKRIGGQTEASTGSAARFFFAADWSLDQAEQLNAADVLRYCAKASRAERDAGLEGFEPQSNVERDGRNQYKNGNALNGSGKLINGTGHITPPHNHHPTVKPLSLCRYLATLLLPPATYAPRRILVPFGGVASEAIGAGLAGWDEIVIVESEREYCDIAEARLAYWLRQPELALR